MKIESRTEIRKSNIKDAGDGVWATENIKENEIICIYGGRVFEPCSPFDVQKLSHYDDDEKIYFMITHSQYCMPFPNEENMNSELGERSGGRGEGGRKAEGEKRPKQKARIETGLRTSWR